MAEDVNFIQNTFKELGATVQLREYIEDDEDEMITCPNCESENIIDDGSGYLQYTCGDCGCIFGNRNDVKCPKCDSNDIWTTAMNLRIISHVIIAGTNGMKMQLRRNRIAKQIQCHLLILINID